MSCSMDKCDYKRTAFPSYHSICMKSPHFTYECFNGNEDFLEGMLVCLTELEPAILRSYD